MPSNEGDRTGRRGFFLSLAAGLGEAVAGAAEHLAPEVAAEPSEAPQAESRPPVLQRRSVPPAAIPDVRR